MRPPPPAILFECHFLTVVDPWLAGGHNWWVTDLVGLGSADGSVAARDGAEPPPFTPGALVAAIRAAIADEIWKQPGASIDLKAGSLSVQLDTGSIGRIDVLLRGLRARVSLPTLGEIEYEVEIR